MSLLYKKGFFDAAVAQRDGIELFVHGCNARGGFGSGVAGMVAREFPAAQRDYFSQHNAGALAVGEVFFVPIKDGPIIVNAVTQDDVGTHQRQVDYEGVYVCLEQVLKYAQQAGLTNLAAPQIGCGLASGQWSIIKPMFEHFFGDSDIDMTIYA